MSVSYTDHPHNMSEIASYVITEKEKIVAEIFGNSKCYFYDTCSFRRHANLDNTHAAYFLRYIKNQNGVVVITRCILMELASSSGVLNQEYVDYIKRMNDAGITILVIYEEDLFSVMEVCFSTNAAINDYLCWAVRTIIGPVSTITETLEKNTGINNKVIKGKNLENAGVYKCFLRQLEQTKQLEIIWVRKYLQYVYIYCLTFRERMTGNFV